MFSQTAFQKYVLNLTVIKYLTKVVVNYRQINKCENV